MDESLFSVAGQVVVVSGASRGIGFGLAEGFARRGARVVVTGREKGTLEKAAREIGDSARGVVCDVSDPKATQRLVEAVVGDFGRIDTLINVAGVNRRMRVEKVAEADWDFVVDTNLKGPFLLSLAAGRKMLERGKGAQINITSLNCDRPFAGVAPYAASKAGLAHMTRSLALEWGPRGVRVNAIAPGIILTDLTRKMLDDPSMKAWTLDHTPLRRVGSPEDLVGAAVFLASEAAAFVTGQMITVDGGFTCGNSWPLPLDPA